jgi:rhodanese-related sulfurtransferase
MFRKKRESALEITPEELARAGSDGSPLVIVDIRSPRQFRDEHLPEAINIPLSELEQRAVELDPAAPTVFY